MYIFLLTFYSIGYAIAKRLGLDGAKVVISSRKQDNVVKAVKSLNQEGIANVLGVMCHVGKSKHRKNLVEKVAVVRFYCKLLIC